MTATLRLLVPFPPSVNNLFATVGKRRIPSERYERWRRETRDELRLQRLATIPGRVSVRIDLVAPDRRGRDCDNYAKAVLDALVRAGVIEDDSLVRRLSIGWEEQGPPCTVIVTACERGRGA